MDVIELVRTFDAKRWRKLGHWKKSFMLDWIEATGLSLDNFQRVGVNWHVDNYCFVAHEAMMAEDDFLSTEQFYEGELTHNNNFPFEHGRRCYDAGNSLIRFSERLSNQTNWTQISNNELSQTFIAFISLVSRNIPFFPPLVAFEQVLDHQLRLLLADHLEKKEINPIHLFDYLNTFSVPKQMPEMLVKREALLEIGRQIQSDKDTLDLFSKNDTSFLVNVLHQKRSDIWTALQRYTNDYGWLATFGWLGTPSDEPGAIDDLRDYLNSDCAEQICSLRASREKSERAIQIALDEL